MFADPTSPDIAGAAAAPCCDGPPELVEQLIVDQRGGGGGDNDGAPLVLLANGEWAAGGDRKDGEKVEVEGVPASEALMLHLITTFQMWWQRALSSRWERTWMEQALTEDCRLSHLSLSVPYHATGRDAVIHFWESSRLMHNGKSEPEDEVDTMEVDWQMAPPELLAPGVVYVTSNRFWAKYHSGHSYRAEGTILITLRGMHISSMVFCPYGGWDPSLSAPPQRWEVGCPPSQLIDAFTPPAGWQSAPPLSEPDDRTGLLGAGPAEWGLLRAAQAMADALLRARLRRQWAPVREWAAGALLPDFAFADYAAHPYPLRTEGVDEWLRYLAALLPGVAAAGDAAPGLAAVPGWELRLYYAPSPRTLRACVDWPRGPGGAPAPSAGLEMQFDAAGRIAAASVHLLPPTGWPEPGQCEPAVQPAVRWDGAALPPPPPQPPAAGGAAAMPTRRPCSHNDWDNLRLKRGWVILRCRECATQWRLRPENAHGARCPAFAPPHARCAFGARCPLLHIRAITRGAEERRRGRGGGAKDAAPAPPAAPPIAGSPRARAPDID